MSKRITGIALFDSESLDKLNEKVNIVHEKFCKVPYREENRKILDTLPYHFTFTVWDAKEKDIAIKVMKNIKFNEISLNIIGVNIKDSFNDSWNLYFEIERNEKLYKLQKEIYNLAKIEKYNPDIFIPHITIHCDKDYSKINRFKEVINKDFIPFKIKVKKIGLFEIYPAERIYFD